MKREGVWREGSLSVSLSLGVSLGVSVGRRAYNLWMTQSGNQQCRITIFCDNRRALQELMSSSGQTD